MLDVLTTRRALRAVVDDRHDGLVKNKADDKSEGEKKVDHDNYLYLILIRVPAGDVHDPAEQGERACHERKRHGHGDKYADHCEYVKDGCHGSASQRFNCVRAVSIFACRRSES
jgi:hypothetical protein